MGRFKELSLRLVSGLVLHGLLAALFLLWGPPLPETDKSLKVDRGQVPVTILLGPQTRTQTAKATPSAASPSYPPTRSKAPRQEKANRPAESYTQLLPKAHELPASSSTLSIPAPENAEAESLGQHSFAPGLSGRERQDLLREGGTLATLFDVPLALRRQKRELKAYAAISMTDDRLKLEYLHGEPILRAVIYEELLEARCQGVLKRALALLPGQRLRLEIITLAQNQRQSNVEASFFWEKGRLILLKTPPPESGVPFPLPDHAAEVARAWDREALSRLHNSLAYRVPLRLRPL